MALTRRLVEGAIVVVTIVAYFAGQKSNPPGFYVDEASIAYNAFCIAQNGHDEWGARMPLFFKAFGEYKNPAYIYVLAAVFRFVHPSNLVARRVSAIAGYLAAACLGLLAYALTRRRWIGWTIFILALITPMLFEVSRLAFEVTLFPLSVALFLIAAYAASRRERWSARLIAALVGSLTLITLAYTTGRLLGILFALSLFILVDRRERFIGAAITLLLYLICGVLPLVIYNHQHDSALTVRARNISYIYLQREHPLQLIRTIEEAYVLNALPLGMALDGDPNPRHHVPNSLGSILLGEFVLAAISIAIIIGTRRHERWWLFMIVLALCSILPSSLTEEGRYHSLRMASYPVALLVLTIPALEAAASRRLRFVVAGALVLCAAQAAWFFHVFAATGRDRGIHFDTGYPAAFDDALAQPERPIYLPTYYVSAYWYAAQRGIDRSNFVGKEHDRSPMPKHAVVLANTDFKCEVCTGISRHEQFTVWITK